MAAHAGDWQQDIMQAQNRMVQIVSIKTEADAVIPTFHVDKLTKVLSKQSCPDGYIVLSIVGKKRTGKSFFICALASYLQHLQQNPDDTSTNWLEQKVNLEGSEWKCGSKSVTKGIWVWEDVLKIKCEDKEFGVLLMDCQGLFDPADSKVKVTDTLITTFALELSKIHIVNVKGDFSSSDLEHLEASVTYAERKGRRTSKQYESLIILHRDWESDSTYGQREDFFTRLEEDRELTVGETNIRDAFNISMEYMVPMPGASIRKGSVENASNLCELSQDTENCEMLTHVKDLANLLVYTFPEKQNVLMSKADLTDTIKRLRYRYADGQQNPKFIDVQQMFEIGDIRDVVKEIVEKIEKIPTFISGKESEETIESEIKVMEDAEMKSLMECVKEIIGDSDRHPHDIGYAKWQISSKLADVKQTKLRYLKEYKEDVKKRNDQAVVGVGIGAGLGVAAAAAAVAFGVATGGTGIVLGEVAVGLYTAAGAGGGIVATATGIGLSVLNYIRYDKKIRHKNK